MKKTRWIVLSVAVVISLGCIVAQAQAQAQGPPNFVAVVDVAQLIKKHPEFEGKQKALQTEMVQEEANFRKRQEDIVKKENALKASPHKPGSAEHQRMMDEIADEYANFDKDAKGMQRKFALKNSQIMFDTYQDIKREVGAFCKQRKIAQVTDYRVFEANPAEPQTVAEDMDQKLVWFDETLNITDHIITQMYARRGMEVPKNTPEGTNVGPAMATQTGGTPPRQ